MDLQLPVQSVPITTNVVSSSPAHGKVYSIQHYVIKFVSDLWQVGVIKFVSDLWQVGVIKFVSDLCQVGGFFRLLRFPLPLKLTTTI
jgi:uncharacterized protein YbcV (DUF1398 family)